MFLDCAALTAEALAAPEVAAHWNEPSALQDFSVFGLAGHLLRSAKAVEIYLDEEEPEGDPLSAVGYYQAVRINSDPNSRGNRAIRERGEEMAAEGAVVVASEAAALTQRLRTRLASEPSGRRVSVIGGLVVSLDEYLRTRIVEIVVHLDDLAVSVGLDGFAPVPPDASAIAISTLVDLARDRQGDLAVLRALARRERDQSEALRVI